MSSVVAPLALVASGGGGADGGKIWRTLDARTVAFEFELSVDAFDQTWPEAITGRVDRATPPVR